VQAYFRYLFVVFVFVVVVVVFGFLVSLFGFKEHQYSKGHMTPKQEILFWLPRVLQTSKQH
jgi:hypothetical protein